MKKTNGAKKQDLKAAPVAPQKPGSARPAARSPDAATVGKDGRSAQDKDGNEAESQARNATRGNRR